MAEEWRPVLHYENSYEVSSYGNVRSLPRQVRGRDGSTRNLQGQKIIARLRDDGSYAVNLWADNKFKQRLVHQLVLESFDRPMPRGAEAVHINGNSRDNRRENLRWELVVTSRKRRAARNKLLGKRF